MGLCPSFFIVVIPKVNLHAMVLHKLSYFSVSDLKCTSINHFMFSSYSSTKLCIYKFYLKHFMNPSVIFLNPIWRISTLYSDKDRTAHLSNTDWFQVNSFVLYICQSVTSYWIPYSSPTQTTNNATKPLSRPFTVECIKHLHLTNFTNLRKVFILKKKIIIDGIDNTLT